MTTATLTLSDFLLARIAEDEGIARDFVTEPGEAWDGGISLWFGGVGINVDGRRVLAECEAKRRIVALYAEHADYDDWENSYEHATGRIVGLGEALRLLALPYADHPDYRDEWRP